ncbi:MAG: hypothetical protein QNK54_03700 [Candidatus Planktophila sp.]
MRNRWLRAFAVIVIIALLMMVTGLRVSHPQGGLSSSLGPAKSTLVLYKTSKEVGVGSKVVVQRNEGGSGLAIVTAVNPDSVDVNLQGSFERIPLEDLGGNLLAVFPFIGVVFGVIGL